MKYLFNKDVLFEDIPYLLAMNFSGYDDGMSYNFWQYKTFSEEEARKHYEQSEEIAPMQEPSEWQARVEENIGLLTDMVKSIRRQNFIFSCRPIPSFGGTACTGAGRRRNISMPDRRRWKR